MSAQPIHNALLKEKAVTLLIRREDLLVPDISGNKWRKLKYNLIAAGKQGYDTLLSFGGAYSNHIYALAAAGKKYGFRTIGLIRGEAHHPLNPTLAFATHCGMQLHYLSRQDYRKKEDPAFQAALQEQYDPHYLIPEGGTNELAVQGCAEIVTDMDREFDYICCPCGTGGTLAGMVTALQPHQTALGFSALKGGAFLEDIVAAYAGTTGGWQILHDYHFGGYAKVTEELLAFVKKFETDFEIPLEPIYTGKMLYGIFDLVKRDYFPRGTVVVAVHTGGLQGLEGLRARGIVDVI